MKTNSRSVKILSVLGLGVALFILPCLEAVNANPNTSRRVGGQRGPDGSGNSSVHINVQDETSGRDNVDQRYTSTQQGTGVQGSASVQFNTSGCAGQNSNQTVSQTRTSVGSGASASVSVCNPARKY